jgi:hypothetical protein
VYSKFINWPDEPGWDCWWLAKGYRIGPASKDSKRVVIPVTYERVGLFCVDSQFQPEEKEETVRYELVRKQGKWKVDGPTPDYPYVGLSAVKDDLSKTISDAKQPPELRAQARRALASIDKLVN